MPLPPPGSFPARSMALVGAVTLFASALYYCFIISGGLVFNEIGITAPSRISELSAIPSLFIILGAVIFRLLGGKSNAVQLGCLFLVLGAGLLGMGIAETVPALVASLVVQQTGAGMTVGSLIAWAQTKLPFEHRGRGMGIWTTCFFFGQFSSPWLVARLEHAHGQRPGRLRCRGCGRHRGRCIRLLLEPGAASRHEPCTRQRDASAAVKRGGAAGGPQTP